MNNDCNKAMMLKDAIQSLHVAKREAENKSRYSMDLYRLVELSEISVKTILQHKKKHYVEEFSKYVLIEEFSKILPDYSKFAKGLCNAMIFHNINNRWSQFFEIFDMNMIDKDVLKKIYDSLSCNRNFITNYSDHRMIENLLNILVDEQVAHVISDDLESKQFFRNNMLDSLPASVLIDLPSDNSMISE